VCNLSEALHLFSGASKTGSFRRSVQGWIYRSPENKCRFAYAVPEKKQRSAPFQKTNAASPTPSQKNNDPRWWRDSPQDLVLLAMKHSKKPAELGAIALALVAICISQSIAGLAAAADPDKVDPCKLITQAEAQSALGMPVKPAEFQDGGPYRFCSFKPAGEGTYYLAISLFSIDKETFDKADLRQMERATGTNLDAFFARNNPLLSVWHAGNQLQVQIHFGDNARAPDAKAKDAELKLAAIAITRF
jgi:hypothetical protein